MPPFAPGTTLRIGSTMTQPSVPENKKLEGKKKEKMRVVIRKKKKKKKKKKKIKDVRS